MAARDRLATLSDGATTYNLALAQAFDPESPPYRLRYVDTVGEPVRAWRVKDWSGGEGDTWWDDKSVFGGWQTYDTSRKVRPLRIGQGLELAAEDSRTQDSTGVSNQADGIGFGTAQGSLWIIEDNNAFKWDSANGRWAAAIATGAAGANAYGLADGHDTWLYAAYSNTTIRRFKSGSSEAWLTSGFKGSNEVAVVDYDGLLFVVDENDLWKVDKTLAAASALTNTNNVQIYDPPGTTAQGMTLQLRNRTVGVSDVGPFFVEWLDDGQAYIVQYNVGDDTARRVHALPRWVVPHSVGFEFGFYWATYRQSESTTGNTQADQAHLWFGRGNQTGSIPLPNRSDPVGNSFSALIAGIVDGQMVVYWLGAFFAYDLSKGALYELGYSDDVTDSPFDAAMLGKDVFVSQSSGSAVYRFQTDLYNDDADATLNSGWHDFGRPESAKIIDKVIVITDPLPANTKVDLGYAVNGATTFTSATGSHDTDNATKYEWTLSDNTGTVKGHTFAFQLKPNTTDTSATPTIRQVVVVASVAERRRVHELLVRLDVEGDVEGHTSTPWDTLSDLKAAMEAGKVWSFSTRWREGPEDTDVAEDVKITGADLTDADGSVARLEFTSVAVV